MADYICFSISDINDCTLVKASRNGDALLAVSDVPGSYKSKFRYFSFEYCCDEQEQNSKSTLVRDMCCKREFFSTGYIADFCDVFNKELIFYVCQEMSGKHELKCYPILYDCPFEVHMKCAEASERYIFSCASNPSGDTAVTGTEHGVCIFHGFKFIHEIALNGYVGSVELDDSGNTVFCGINSSGLKVIDLRGPSISPRNSNFYSSIKVSNMKLLPSEKGIIVCGEDGYLSQVDLRTFKTVLRYPDHVSHGRKATISLHEGFDILCATGSDNITRLWELSTGNLLHYISPPVPSDKSHGCLLANEHLFKNEAYGFVTILQKDVCFVVETESE